MEKLIRKIHYFSKMPSRYSFAEKSRLIMQYLCLIGNVTIPPPVIRYLSSFLDLKHTSKLSQLNKSFRSALKTELEKKMISIIEKNLIGPEKWNQAFGYELSSSNPSEEMIQCLMSYCPFEGNMGKRIFETHRAIYIPKNLTLSGLIKNSAVLWSIYCCEEINDNAHWIVMRKWSTPEKDYKAFHCLASVLETVSYFVMTHKFFPEKNPRDLEPRLAKLPNKQQWFHIVFDPGSNSGSWIRILSLTEKLNLALLQKF